MLKLRTLAAVSLLATSMIAVPANAQVTGGNRSSACQQTQGGGGTAIGDITPGNRSQANRQEVFAGLIAAAISNVNLDVTALNNVLNSANVNIVCVNDVLNQNDIEVLSHILERSPILSHNRDVLSNNEVVKNVLNNNNIAANVEVISLDLLSGTFFLLGQ
jgi:hypothetical protein